MESNKLNHVAQKLWEHATVELADVPLLARMVPGWEEYLPQARVALQAVAEWNAHHERAGPRG